MYSVGTTAQFEKSVKICKMRGKRIQDLWDVVAILVEEGCLPEAYSPHMLSGVYAGLWECHIEEDWLLVWRQNDKQLTLLLTDTGTHEDLFGKKE
ncbi:MAG: type II toxin-antitoxin system YafQ family toxin [Paludibacteraceae bacterium]|nr:type II toxin-antitoxin system YafQ family toxin [Paludibacteraceae bacterium]